MLENEVKRLTEDEFVFRAIKKLRGKYKGIHTVYSGFNEAFRDYFGTDPIETTQRLLREGKISIRPAKGGVLIFLPEDLTISPTDTLSKILED